jgi:putative copper export protein
VNWLQFGVQWLHVLLGITWFGYAISIYFLVRPAINQEPEAQQRLTYTRMGQIAARVMAVVSVSVLLLGIIRGTVFGPIQSFEAAFTTAYGITWLVALVVTVGLIVNGARNIGPLFSTLADTPDYPAAAARLVRLSQIDLVMFGIVFTCMILMRFGY